MNKHLTHKARVIEIVILEDILSLTTMQSVNCTMDDNEIFRLFSQSYAPGL